MNIEKFPAENSSEKKDSKKPDDIFLESASKEIRKKFLEKESNSPRVIFHEILRREGFDDMREWNELFDDILASFGVENEGELKEKLKMERGQIARNEIKINKKERADIEGRVFSEKQRAKMIRDSRLKELQEMKRAGIALPEESDGNDKDDNK